MYQTEQSLLCCTLHHPPACVLSHTLSWLTIEKTAFVKWLWRCQRSVTALAGILHDGFYFATTKPRHGRAAPELDRLHCPQTDHGLLLLQNYWNWLAIDPQFQFLFLLIMTMTTGQFIIKILLSPSEAPSWVFTSTYISNHPRDWSPK